MRTLPVDVTVRAVEIGQLIIRTPGTCGGRARVAGHRVPVSSVYRWFLSGHAPEDILEKYDGLNLAQIYAAIAYALANRDEIGAEIREEDRLAPLQPFVGEFHHDFHRR